MPFMLTVTEDVCTGVAGGGGDTGEVGLPIGKSLSLAQEQNSMEVSRMRVEFFIAVRFI